MSGNNGMYGNNLMYGSSQINPVSEERVIEPVQPVETLEAREEESVALPQEQVTDFKAAANKDSVAGEPLPWLSVEDVDELQSRWNAIQLEFMDEPRSSVEQAGVLVGDALKRIDQALSTELTSQGERWNHADTSTEDLRVALRSYRTLLNRLLAL